MTLAGLPYVQGRMPSVLGESCSLAGWRPGGGCTNNDSGRWAMAWDHCHKHGRVRGALCTYHNTIMRAFDHGRADYLADVTLSRFARRCPSCFGELPAATGLAEPGAAYSARISHTTTPGQLEALEALRTAEKATGGGAVSITALLRAATALCLDDPRLRARWIKAARTEWR